MKIQQDLDRLITVLNKDANEQLREDINNFSRKVLSSQMGRPTTETGVELKEKIVTKVDYALLRSLTSSTSEVCCIARKLYKDF